jgi:hypothetical protein
MHRTCRAVYIIKVELKIILTQKISKMTQPISGINSNEDIEKRRKEEEEKRKREETDDLDFKKGTFTVSRGLTLIFFLIAAVLTIILALHYSHIITPDNWVIILFWSLWSIFILASIVSWVYQYMAKSAVETTESRIDREFSKSINYFDTLVKINVENLDAYYKLVKKHTSQSFNVSLMVSIMGFLLICCGLIIGYNLNDNIISYIMSGSGVLIEFISGVLFFLYNKTIRQLKNYHDSLINVQNILLSFKLIDDMKDDNQEAKTDLTTKLIEHIVNTAGVTNK